MTARSLVRLVGVALVRNEDVFVERAIRNAADACDRIHAFDHVSTDGTWPILKTLSKELDHLEVRRCANAAESHRQLEQYAATPSWVLRIDGDHLFDPNGLVVLARPSSPVSTETSSGSARTPSTATSWTRRRDWPGVHGAALCAPACSVQPRGGHVLAGRDRGAPRRRSAISGGYAWDCMRDLTESTDWQSDLLRLLHVCFLRRPLSTRTPSPPGA